MCNLTTFFYYKKLTNYGIIQDILNIGGAILESKLSEISCDLCGSNHSKLLFTNHDRMFPEIKGIYNLFKCEKCGLIFIHPQPSPVELSDHYPSNYSVFEEGEQKHLRKVRTLLETFYQYSKIKSGESIFFRLIYFLFIPLNPIFRTTVLIEKGNFLDVGCGIGYFTLVMKYLGMNSYGIEPGEFDDELARQYNLNIIKGTLPQSDYKNDFFDVITLNHVLEHVDNPSEVMKELNRILKPGGYLIIATPTSDSLAFKIFGKYWAQIDSPRHLFIFSKEILEEYAKKFGFEVVKVRYNSIPEHQIIGSIIYSIEDKRKTRYNRNLAENPFLNLLLFPFSSILNLIKSGDQLEIILKK